MTRWLFLLLVWAAPAFADPAILAAVNAERQEAGRTALVWDAQLERAAEAHARDMARRGYFSHSSPDGGTMSTRVAGAGYRACFAAENIAKGQKGVAQVMRSWMGSRGHRRNILHRRAQAVGVARAAGDVWVMVLAAPC